MHLLLRFEDGRKEEELIRKAKESGIRVYGLSQYCIKPDKNEEGQATILLGYANMSEEAIREAAALLKTAWK